MFFGIFTVTGKKKNYYPIITGLSYCMFRYMGLN